MANIVQILVQIGSVGASPQVGEILCLGGFFWLSCHVQSYPVLSFSRSHAQMKLLDLFSHFMAQTMWFRARRCLFGVTTID